MRENQGIPLGPPRDVAGTRLSGAEPGSRSGLQNPKFLVVNTPLYCFLYVCVKAGKTLLKNVLFLFIIFIYLFYLQLEKIDNTHHPPPECLGGDRGQRPACTQTCQEPAHCRALLLHLAGRGLPWALGLHPWMCGRQGEGCPLALF